MKELRKKINRFILRNSNKGIPNLMLYIVIGCGIVSALTTLGYTDLYSFLCFDKEAILRGQVWRLFSYVFTMSSSNILSTLIVLYCTYSLGRAVETRLGTLKFNLYYLIGILLMDGFAMIFSGSTYLHDFEGNFSGVVPMDTAGYYAGYMMVFLHLSLVLCYATLYPDTQFYLFFIIPIRAWLMSLFYFIYILFEIIRLTVPVMYLPHNLFPLVAILNYLLFFGKDAVNLFPLSWRAKANRIKKKPSSSANPIPFRPTQKEKPDYSHRCTVCGRTNLTDPQLEFRYCSRCAGYHCYCIDHINDHSHITE